MPNQPAIRFYRDLASLLTCSRNLLASLKLLASQSDGQELTDCLHQLIKELECGHALHEAMAKCQYVFPTLVIKLIRLAEERGLLEEFGEMIADAYAKEFLPNNKQDKIKNLSLLLAVLALLMDNESPSKGLAEEFEVCRCLYEAQACEEWQEALKEFAKEGNPLWQELCGHKQFFPPALLRLFKQTDFSDLLNPQKLFVDLSAALSKKLIPGFNYDDDSKIINSLHMLEQYFTTLSLLLSNGFSLGYTLEYFAQSYDDSEFTSCMEQMAASVRSGEPLAYAMQQHPQYFSDIVCFLIGAAEINGDLANTLSTIKDAMDRGSFLPSSCY